MKLDLQRVKANVAKASTEDLLDRATVYRAEMEAVALGVIDRELSRRGITALDIQRHQEKRSEALRSEAGCAVKCCRCHAPAIVRKWGWLKLWKRIPIIPWHFRYCRDHVPFGPE